MMASIIGAVQIHQDVRLPLRLHVELASSTYKYDMITDPWVITPYLKMHLLQCLEQLWCVAVVKRHELFIDVHHLVEAGEEIRVLHVGHLQGSRYEGQAGNCCRQEHHCTGLSLFS